MAGLSITEVDEGAVTLATLDGVLDGYTVSTLTGYFDQTIGRGRLRLVLQPSGIDFVGSAGIGAFIAAQKRTQDLGGGIWLLSPSPCMREIIEILGIDALFPIFNDRAAAVAAAGADIDSPT